MYWYRFRAAPDLSRVPVQPWADLCSFLPQTDCTLVGRLGSGGCATVDLYEVKLAVKKPRTEEDALRLRKEALGMAGLNHPNIAKPVCWIRPADGGPLALAMPYLSAGTLDSVLWCVPSPSFHTHLTHGHSVSSASKSSSTRQ